MTLLTKKEAEQLVEERQQRDKRACEHEGCCCCSRWKQECGCSAADAATALSAFTARR
jgi:hypothetical protein